MSFHDSIELEKRGVTAYVIASNTFVPLVLAQARARKLKPKLIVVQHPVGGLHAEDLVDRIDTAYEALTGIMAA